MVTSATPGRPPTRETTIKVPTVRAAEGLADDPGRPGRRRHGYRGRALHTPVGPGTHDNLPPGYDYLAKETVQNMLAVRFANAIFEPIWNRTWVDNVQITVAESIGAEGGGFYETAGAMRDIVQNHVLQVLSLFLMEPPTSFHPEAIRDEKLKLLRAIRPFAGEQDITRRAIRGQYARGGTREHPMPGYREEPGVDPVSPVETFAALRLDIDNWRWAGVPVYVRTGKRLPQRITEVAIAFQRPPQLPLFPGSDPEPDALLLRVAPSEGLSIRFGAKVPGRSFHVRQASMDFAYAKAFRTAQPTPTSGSYSMRCSVIRRCSSARTKLAGPGASWTRSSSTGPRPPTRSRCTRRERGGPATRMTSSPPTAGAGGTRQSDAPPDG